MAKYRETRQCPPEFQERITRMFGTNPFGEPIFRIAWAQSEFQKMGALWKDKYGNERSGYFMKHVAAPSPCWMILRWKASNEYGNPTVWYMNSYHNSLRPEEFSDGAASGIEQGYYILGDYPWKGRYEVLYVLQSKEFDGRTLKVEALQLNHTLIDKIIPLLINTRFLSQAEQRAAKQAAIAREEQEQTNKIADMLADGMPILGPVSYSMQGCRTARIDQMMQKIQQKWDAISRNGRPLFQRGMFQSLSNRPRITGFKN